VVDVSSKTKDVFHYLLAKPVVLQIASQYSNNNNTTKQGNETSNTTFIIQFKLKLKYYFFFN
jgi:hypothetical protein